MCAAVSESQEQFTGLSRYTLKMACESRGERDCYSVQILLIAMLVQLFNIGGSTFQYTYLSEQKRAEKTGKATSSSHTATFLRGGTAEVIA